MPTTFLQICQFISILWWLIAGVVLLWFPWRQAWDSNYLLFLYPQFKPIVSNSFFKGFVLGLGIVNILIGIQEITHRKDDFKNFFLR